MGFLRKVGRKIKKGVKKLFSSKLGRFVGSIALSMIMGPVVSKAFNGIKNVFTGAVQKGTETLVQEGVQKVVEEKAVDVTTKNVIDNTVTGAMEKVVNNEALSNDLLLQAQKGLKGEIPKPSKFTVSDITVAKPSPLPKPTLGQEIGNKFADFGTGVKEFAADPFGKTKEYVGGNFIPDVARSVGEQYVMGAIQGEPEETFYSKGVQQVGSMEGPQTEYMAEVRNQIPNLQATNFNQLNQSLFYGTLSPQYLMGQMG